eukprot:scaffold3952_cov73-Cyclotella_meneghiniana.AAC.4
MVDDTSSSPLSNDDIISSLSEPLRTFAAAAFPADSSGNEDDETDAAKAKRLDELEVALRSHALSLVEELMMHEDDGSSDEFNSALENLLSYLKDVTLFTVDMVQHVASAASHHDDCKSPKSYTNATNPIFHRLPHTLLSDATSTLPISTVQKLWSYTPTSPFHPQGWSSYLCHPCIFKVGNKMLLLRICNGLLKSCSNRDVDAEFAGSIMTTLSQVFPLSERSAMNVLGSFNVENCTRYEEKEEFEKGLEVRQTLNSEKNGNEDSGMDVDGDNHVGTVTTASSLGYDFYSTFWGVQKIFTDPPGTILAVKGGYECFETFIKDIKTILAVFESTPAIASTTSKAASEQVNHHYKYLTSSQLLHLQLKDPEMRTHLLTQLIILLSHLNSSSVTLPAPSISSTPGSNPTKLNAQLKQAQQIQLSDLEKRTQQLLKSIKPGGETHLRAICWILKERESMWRNWKKNKCAPPLEKVDDKTKVVSSSDIRQVLSGKKRRAVDVATDNNGMDLKKDLPGILCQMKSTLSSLDLFLQPYVEACDPENEIDAEYHPANDSVYCWRALRLMARSQEGEGQLHRFGKLRRRDGNFEGIVRDMWKIDKGEEIGGDYVDVEDEEEQFRPKHKKKAVDAVMDDVSVGTPEVDESAKKEKMAEFEKAAMDMEDELFSEDEKTDEADAAGKPAANGSISTKNDSSIPPNPVDNEKKAAKEETDTTVDDNTDKSSKNTAAAKNENNASGEKSQDSLTADAKKTSTVKSVDKNGNETASKDTKSSNSTPQAATTKSNGAKDTKPTAHSVKTKAKFTPKEQLRQKQQEKSREQPNKTQTHQDRPKESGTSQHSDDGPGRRGSDSRAQTQGRGGRGSWQPPPHSGRGRGGRESSRGPRDDSSRGPRDDNGPPMGRGGGRGSWKPPPHAGMGRGGRDSNRGTRDDRRGGRDRR